jgi:tetraacyldisaccharide 4'-kinase
VNTPVTDWLRPVTAPAAWAYGVAVGWRNRRYDRGRGVRRVGVPVVSVGNLTVGGVGKTPMVAWIAERLLAGGHRPVIAMRGYKARPGEPSDEEAEYGERLPDVDVVAHPDRATALGAYLERYPDVDCALLDDGFQHRRLHRDLDLVLVDASRAMPRERLLPAGRLREPPESLRRADAVVLTHGDERDDGLVDWIERRHGRPPVAATRHRWSALRVFGPEGETAEPVAWLAGRRLLTLLGVGHPGAVRRQLEAAGATVAVDVPAGDHERYHEQKLRLVRGLCEPVDAMVVTGKDWVKVRRLIDLADWPAPIVVPRLVMDVYEGADRLEALVARAVVPRPASP